MGPSLTLSQESCIIDLSTRTTPAGAPAPAPTPGVSTVGIIILAMILAASFHPLARHLDRVDRLNRTNQLGS